MRFTTFIVKYIISIADWTKTIKKIQASATVFVCTVCTFGWIFFWVYQFLYNTYEEYTRRFVNHKYHINTYMELGGYGTIKIYTGRRP